MTASALTALLRDAGSGTPARSAGLARDSRGAILLISVFMSAFLVGCLWYVIGIGDAAIYRQYMQDGADSVAFGSAVYHARGMNILALINLVMAAVLAVLIAFKMAQVVLIAANILSCVCAAASYGANAFCDTACTVTGDAESPMSDLVDEVSQIVDKVLRILHYASNAVAYGMPWIAEGKALSVAQDYKPTVDGGAMISTSLVPGVVEGALGGFKKSAQGDSNRYGLPVEDEDFNALCKRAGKEAGEMIMAPFDFLGIPGVGGFAAAFGGGLMGSLAGSFPSYFCGDSGSGGGSYSATTGGYGVDGKGTTVQQDCDNKAQKVKDENAKIGAENKTREAAGKPDLPLKPPFDVKQCVSDENQKYKMVSSGSSVSGSSEKTSKKVFEPACNGDVYFAVWSFTWGDLASQSDAATGVNIAGWNNAKAAGPERWSKVAIAKAEFYYEPMASQGGAWSGLKDEAMWNMRWRARMRRLRLPQFSLGNWLIGKVGGDLQIPFVSDLLGDPLSKAAGIVDDAVGNVLGGLRSGSIVH